MKRFRPGKIVLLLVLATGVRLMAAEPTYSETPVGALGFYNAGTKLLETNKFADAQRMFEAALAAQDERVQPPALYNLGQARFADGAERLKQGPDAQKAGARGDAALAAGGNAIRSLETALLDTNLDKMIAAYHEGRGARHRLRDTETAVQAALTTFGYTLRQWQGALDAFKSTGELNPADTNAAYNAGIVERAIARLVDSERVMQQMAGQMGDQKRQLDQLLGKLKGRIPSADAPPGGAGDDDEGLQPESLAGRKEGDSREGGQQQIPISPDLAKQLLDGISIDGAHRLFLSDQQGTPPGNRTGRNW